MKKLAAICFLIASLHARADLVLVEKIDGAGPLAQGGDITVKIKGDKIRTDMSAQMSSITDTNSGDIVMLMHGQKSYMIMSAAKTKMMMDQMKAMAGKPAASATPQAAPKFVSTGKKEEVSGYKTEIFTANYDGNTITCWVAADFPNAASLMQQLRKMQESMLSKLGGSMGSAPKMDSLPGVPIKTEFETGGKKITTTIVSLKEEPVNAADLEIPSGYTEMKMPSFGKPADGQ